MHNFSAFIICENSRRENTIVVIFILMSFFIGTTGFILVFYNYVKYYTNQKNLDENDPDILVNGLYNVDWNTKEGLSYNPNISGMGYTNKLILNCYIGTCKITTSSGDDTHVEYHTLYTFSEECHRTKKLTCTCPKKYDGPGTCTFKKNYTYNKEYSCETYNMNKYWRNKYYRKENATKYGNYSYLRNGYLFNESCPNNTHFCGYLNEHRNKLCLPTNENCPMNYLTSEKPTDKLKYINITLPNGQIIYLTNENFNETGKVIQGFYTDTDLLINYNTCKILDQYKISSFIKENFKSYVGALDYDPYNLSDTELDSKGHSYLRYCEPGVNRERDLNIIRYLKIKYDHNCTLNRNFIVPIRSNFAFMFYSYLIGFLVLLIVVIFNFLDCILSSSYSCDNCTSLIFWKCVFDSDRKILGGIMNYMIFSIFSFSSLIYCLRNQTKLDTIKNEELTPIMFFLSKLNFSYFLCLSLTHLILFFMFIIIALFEKRIIDPKEDDDY